MADPAADFGNSLASTAQNTGQGSINSFDPQGTANSQRAGYNSLYGNQTGTVNDYTKNFANTIASQPKLSDTYSNLNQQYNVPGLAANANYLQNQVTNATPQAYQLARGFDYSEPQVENAINTNLRFLEPQATAATNQLQTAQNLVNQGVGFQQTQNQYELQPIQQQGQMLNDAMARQSTGYTQANQSEFEGLIQKMQSGVQLSQAEMDRANQLAAQETAYQNTLTQANASQNVAKLGNQNYILNPSQQLYNTGTGKTYTNAG